MLLNCYGQDLQDKQVRKSNSTAFTILFPLNLVNPVYMFVPQRLSTSKVNDFYDNAGLLNGVTDFNGNRMTPAINADGNTTLPLQIDTRLSQVRSRMKPGSRRGLVPNTRA